ncbi:DUF5683 domain-containing protein [Prevotella ihumii]|uniref:DUF5683 domain-containing protein n=1 Tax=Prevotella ihumii TaxID=1917878 RepID=UPI0009810DD2
MYSSKNIIRRQLIALAAVAISSVSAVAQTIATDTLTVLYPEDSTTVKAVNLMKNEPTMHVDTYDTQLSDLAKMDEKKAKKDWSKWKPKPKKAVWLAIALPGAGQVYNRKYWKLPIFYGGIAGCIYAMTWNNQKYKDYSQAYIDIADDDPNTQSYNEFLHLGNTITEANKDYYKNVFKKRKDKFRRWRDLSIFATVAVYALSVIDAYVDASLSDFDISDDLSLHIQPTVISDNSFATERNPFKSSAIGIGCSLNF